MRRGISRASRPRQIFCWIPPFTYELGLISKLLGVVRRQFTLEGHNAELWDETARRFEHVAPLELELLPEDSMLRNSMAAQPAAGHRMPMCEIIV